MARARGTEEVIPDIIEKDLIIDEEPDFAPIPYPMEEGQGEIDLAPIPVPMEGGQEEIDLAPRPVPMEGGQNRL